MRALAAAQSKLDECRVLLESVREVLDDEIGDSDPVIFDLTDDEIRDQEPLYWACMKISETLNRNLGGE